MDSDTTYYNGQRAWEICDGDAELFSSLVGVFLETVEEMQDGVGAALSGPSADLEDALHKLKGALRNLACTPAVVIMQKAEDAARSGDVAAAAGLWKEAVPLLERTAAFLASGEWRPSFLKT